MTTKGANKTQPELKTTEPQAPVLVLYGHFSKQYIRYLKVKDIK